MHADCKKNDQHHYVKECPLLKKHEALRNRLLDEWRRNNPHHMRRNYKALKSMAVDNNANHSTLFTAIFAQSIEALVIADKCADDNLMPPAIFKLLEKSNSDFNIKYLHTPIEYSMAVDVQGTSGVAKVVCSNLVTTDVELSIRYGTNLLLRNAEWAVCEQQAKHVLIGRLLLGALGFDTAGIFEAACDKHNGIVNVPEILSHDRNYKSGTLAKLMRDSGIFHCQNGDDEYAEDDDIYIDLWEDRPGEVQAALGERIEHAREQGNSTACEKKLRSLLHHFVDIYAFVWEKRRLSS